MSAEDELRVRIEDLEERIRIARVAHTYLATRVAHTYLAASYDILRELASKLQERLETTLIAL